LAHLNFTCWTYRGWKRKLIDLGCSPSPMCFQPGSPGHRSAVLGWWVKAHFLRRTTSAEGKRISFTFRFEHVWTNYFRNTFWHFWNTPSSLWEAYWI
jgi:hypothetical protein